MIGNKGKGFISLIIVIVISLGISAAIYYLLQQEKTKNVQLSEELTTTQSKNKSLQSELDEALNKVSTLQASLSEVEQQVSSLTADLKKERSQKQESSAQLSQIKQELEQQKALRDNLQKKLTDSEQALNALDTRVKEMETQLKDLEAVKTALENKVKGYEEKKNVELGKIVVSQDGAGSAAVAPASVAGAPAKAMEGKILVMNKDYNFAVINLGNKDGVAAGNVFTVFHNNKAVAELTIEKVHDSMSAAGFPPEIKNKIVEGDKVALKSK